MHYYDCYINYTCSQNTLQPHHPLWPGFSNLALLDGSRPLSSMSPKSWFLWAWSCLITSGLTFFPSTSVVYSLRMYSLISYRWSFAVPSLHTCSYLSALHLNGATNIPESLATGINLFYNNTLMRWSRQLLHVHCFLGLLICLFINVEHIFVSHLISLLLVLLPMAQSTFCIFFLLLLLI